MYMVNEERMEEIKKKLLQDKENRKKNVIEYFKTMKPFRTIDDIPDIPITDKDTYENIIIPNLIRCGAIPKDKLITGETYIGTCRNATEAIWDGKQFIYKRTKFGYTYDETINHFQDDDGYDLFIPVIIIQ